MKKVGSACYVHKSNVYELSSIIPLNEFQQILRLLKAFRMPFEVVKYDRGNLTLIDSPDWNTANEPTVGDSYRWKSGMFFDTHGNPLFPTVRRYNPDNPQIYHSKWMFVAPSYKGFNVERAKKRSALWQSVLPKTKEVKSRIGYRRYWNMVLEKYGLPK